MHKCPQPIKEKVYTTLVRPILEYCSPIWDPYHTTKITKIENIQNKAARFVLNIPYKRELKDNQPRGLTLSNNLHWPSLEHRRKLHRLTLLYKIYNGKIAIPNSYLPQTSTRASRHSNTKKMEIPHSNINSHKFSTIPRTVT